MNKSETTMKPLSRLIYVILSLAPRAVSPQERTCAHFNPFHNESFAHLEPALGKTLSHHLLIWATLIRFFHVARNTMMRVLKG